MNIAVVDDIEEERIRIKECLEQYAQQNSVQCSIRMFENADSLLADYRPLQYTVVFLDIYMPRTTGIDAAEKIREIDKDTTLVFLTDSMDHMPEAFSFHAFDYIKKPAELTRISRLMDDILKQHEVSNKALTFIYDKENMSIPYSDIVALCSSGHYLEIYSLNGEKYKTRMNFSTINDRIKNETRFLLINRGVIVNMDHIKEFKNGSCYLEGGIMMPSNIRNSKNLESIWHNYLFTKMRQRTMGRGNQN